MKKILIYCINLYQRAVTGIKKDSCKFYPTCSDYAKEAIEKHGSLKGVRLSISRILRCHPWAENRVDKVE